MKNRMKERALIITAILTCLFWIPRGVMLVCISTPYLGNIDGYDACGSLNNFVTPLIQPHLDGSILSKRDFSLSIAEKAWQSRELRLPDRMAYAMLTIRIPSASDRDNRSVQKAYHRRLLTWLKRGAELDPGNALYNLRMAYIYFDDACEFTGTRKMTGLSDSVRWNRTRDRYYQMPFEISDRASLTEGISQYHQLLSKPLRTYQHESLRLLYTKHARPWITEQYYLIAEEYLGVIRPPKLGNPTHLYMVAKRLAKEGNTQTASELLDMDAYLRLHANHVGLGGRKAELLDRSETLWEIAISQGQPAKAQNYVRIKHRLFNSDWSEPYYLDRWANIPLLSLIAQVNWAIVIGMLILLVMFALVRQLFWTIQSRVSHTTPLSISDDGMPHRIAAICTATVAIIILVVTIVLLIFSESSSSLQSDLTVGLGYSGIGSVLVCWLVFRHQFKKLCEKQAVPIPNRWNEVACNWIPLLALGLLYFAFVHMLEVDYRYDVLRLVGVLLTLFAVYGCTKWKCRTPDYYALANRETRRFMTRLAVLIALIVMPLLLSQEVLMLQVGKTGLPVYKSIDTVIKYDQASNREDVQQVQRLLKDAQR